MTSVVNNPAINLLSNYPSGVGSLLTATFVQCDPTNGNFFAATNRDLVTFVCLPAIAAPAWSAVVTYTVGEVVNVSSVPYIAISNVAPNLNQNPPTSPTFWQPYTSSSVSVFSAPDSCTGRKADISNYPVPSITGTVVPVMLGTEQAVEFLVLPSSFFTQANGQVQFQASSNLVYVYVRSL